MSECCSPKLHRSRRHDQLILDPVRVTTCRPLTPTSLTSPDPVSLSASPQRNCHNTSQSSSDKTPQILLVIYLYKRIISVMPVKPIRLHHVRSHCVPMYFDSTTLRNTGHWTGWSLVSCLRRCLVIKVWNYGTDIATLSALHMSHTASLYPHAWILVLLSTYLMTSSILG